MFFVLFRFVFVFNENLSLTCPELLPALTLLAESSSLLKGFLAQVVMNCCVWATPCSRLGLGQNLARQRYLNVLSHVLLLVLLLK